MKIQQKEENDYLNTRLMTQQGDLSTFLPCNNSPIQQKKIVVVDQKEINNNNSDDEDSENKRSRSRSAATLNDCSGPKKKRKRKTKRSLDLGNKDEEENKQPQQEREKNSNGDMDLQSQPLKQFNTRLRKNQIPILQKSKENKQYFQYNTLSTRNQILNNKEFKYSDVNFSIKFQEKNLFVSDDTINPPPPTTSTFVENKNKYNRILLREKIIEQNNQEESVNKLIQYPLDNKSSSQIQPFIKGTITETPQTSTQQPLLQE